MPDAGGRKKDRRGETFAAFSERSFRTKDITYGQIISSRVT